MADDTERPHPLHQKIGDALMEHVAGILYQVILDPDCGGRENIPFFMTDQRGSDTRMCNVDALILDEREEPRIAIEIDESTLKPTQVCGNFLTTALARNYSHRNHARISPAPLENLLFIQVLDDSKLKPESRKHRQSDLINEKIQGLLKTGGSFSIQRYELLWASGLGEDCSNLVRMIEGFLQSGSR